jgi:metal-dependent amidase/aminoacylase/carboxypeptidase family protein
MAVRTPHLARPTSPIAQAHFVLALQTIVGRNVAPLDAAVLSVGFDPGRLDVNASNVIPAELTVIGGTSRTYTKEVRDLLERRIAELAAGDWRRGLGLRRRRSPLPARHVPALVNACRAGTDVAISGGLDRWSAMRTCGRPAAPPVTGGEDFAELMLEARPGAFMRIGGGNRGRTARSRGSTRRIYRLQRRDHSGRASRYWVGLVDQELGQGWQAIAAE